MFKTYFVKSLKILYSTTLIIMSIYSNFIIYPFWNCLMVIGCHNSLLSTQIKSVFSRTISMVCLVSRIKNLFYEIKNCYRLYGNKVEEYEINFPNGADETNECRIFVFLVVFTYTVIILPVNLLRAYYIYCDMRDINVVIWFMLMYVENWSICSTETHFIARCFGLYQKFRRINDDMTALRSEPVFTNRYPFVIQRSVSGRAGSDRVRNKTYDGILSSQRIDGCATATFIELLRIRHQYVRDMFDNLNDLYGLQLALSLSGLFVMILTAGYREYFRLYSCSWYTTLYYGWLLHLFFRFFAIVLTTHLTSKQAYKTKILITDIDNAYLDNNTKEELNLFSNQIFPQSVEFTTCDLFTFNTRLITSAIAAGTTYFIILIQCH